MEMMGMRTARLVVFSVVTLAAFLAAGASHAGSAEGKKVFASKNCGSCHQTVGPASEKTIEDQLKKKGPELWYVGSKLQKAFLEQWLKDPKPIRPMEYYSLTKKNSGNHPKLAGKDVADVTEYLMGLTSPEVKKSGIKPSGGPKGKLIFTKKQGCYGCHSYEKGGKVLGGLTGPSLVGAGKRLQPDWIYAYMVNPKVFKPVKDMPVYEGILSDKELKDVSEYVASFK